MPTCRHRPHAATLGPTGVTLLLAALAAPRLARAQPAVPAPAPALLWECDPARRAAQAWAPPPPPGVNGTIALAGNASLALTVLAWPAYARNVAVVSAGPLVTATPFSFSPATGLLVAAAGSQYAPAGACVGPAYLVPFHGAALATAGCPSDAANSTQAWAYHADDGTLRLVANASLCLDWGSTFTCAADGAGLGYCDAAAPPAARAADLAGRLSPAEAAALLSSNNIVTPLNYGTNFGLPARGVPPLWFSECCHGAVAACGAPGSAGGSGCPTALPAGLATGASLNATAWAAAGVVVSTEARALYNQGLHGLGCSAPNVNPFRAPQWGRGPEVPSEDPFLNGEWGTAYAAALQGEGDAPVLRVLATLKHGTAYDMEDSDGQQRTSFDARVSARDLAEYYWPPFRAVAQRARPRFMMASYNAVNGVPNAANALFMAAVLRGQWGWQGATVTDCGGLEGVDTAHHYAPTPNATIAAALAAGLDCECGSWIASYGAGAVAAGAVPAAAMQLAARRALTAWFEAGFMTGAPPGADPYAGLGGDAVDTPAARALALEMAVQGAALLRNAPAPGTGRPLLPLAAGAGLRRLALVGPHANSTADLLGPYSPPANAVVANNSLAAALARRGAAAGFTVAVAPGCNSTACGDTTGFPEAVAAAAGADVVVAAMGLSGQQEGEGHDRTGGLTLPGQQEALLAAVAAAGKPVILLLVHGGPIALQAAADAAAWPAVLTLFYPGQAGGEAAVRLLFGDVSPSGRTLVTWYPPEFHAQRLVTDMQLQPHTNGTGAAVPGITYRWYGGPALFPFGTGGSYTTFRFDWCSTPAAGQAGAGAGPADAAADARALAACAAAPPSYCVNVTNTGPVPSDVSVLAFVSAGQPDEPLEEVFAFGRLAALAPGETRSLAFSMDLGVLASGRPGPAAVAAADPPGSLYLHPGDYTVRVGDTAASGNFAQAALRLAGDAPALYEGPRNS